MLSPDSLVARFCRCIGSVRKTIRPRKKQSKESAAIAVCVSSLLHKRGRTVKQFRCNKKPFLKTQPLIKK